MNTAQLAFDREFVAALSQSLDEPSWLAARRLEAWQAWADLNWPARTDEEWLRTDIRAFKLDDFAPALPEASDAADVTVPPDGGLLSQGVELAGKIVTVNGYCRQVDLRENWYAKGVLFGSLTALAREHRQRLEPYFDRVAAHDSDRFAALHGAFRGDGCVLIVPRGVCLDQPLHVLHALGEGGVDFGHLLVILEDGAEATVLAEMAGAGPTSGGLHCGAIELVVGDGANLRFVSLQNWGQGAWHFAHQHAIVGRDASLQWTIAAIGSRLSKVNQHVALRAAGASCQVNGVLFTEGKQHLSYHTRQHHQAPRCRSDFLYKAALQDKSRTVWRGMIKVDPAAQQTDGYQRNDNLLLSAACRADSIPGLEIEADDVRCTHGSTSGRVDEELIFYARCRGFTRQEAVRMIVSGFFQQIFDRITIPSVREALGQAITRRVREYV